MSLAKVMEELPHLTFEERQLLIRRALELDDPALSVADETLVDQRLAAHYADPDSSIALEEVKARLRARPSK